LSAVSRQQEQERGPHKAQKEAKKGTPDIAGLVLLVDRYVLFVYRTRIVGHVKIDAS
jgi:hypothetical protein